MKKLIALAVSALGLSTIACTSDATDPDARTTDLQSVVRPQSDEACLKSCNNGPCSTNGMATCAKDAGEEACKKKCEDCKAACSSGSDDEMMYMYE